MNKHEIKSTYQIRCTGAISLILKGKTLCFGILMLMLMSCAPAPEMRAPSLDINKTNPSDKNGSENEGNLVFKLGDADDGLAGQLPFYVLFQRGLPSQGFLDRFHNPTSDQSFQAPLKREEVRFRNAMYALRTAKAIDLLYVRRDIALLMGGTERLRLVKKSSDFSLEVTDSFKNLYIVPKVAEDGSVLSAVLAKQENSFLMVERMINSIERAAQLKGADHSLRRKVLRQLLIEASIASYIEDCYMDEAHRKRFLLTEAEKAIPFDRYFAEVMARSKVLAVGDQGEFFYKKLFTILTDSYPDLIPNCHIDTAKSMIGLFDRDVAYRAAAFEGTAFKPLHDFVFSHQFGILYNRDISMEFDQTLAAWLAINGHLMKKISEPVHYEDDPSVFLLLASDTRLWTETYKLFQYMESAFDWKSAKTKAMKLIEERQKNRDFIENGLLLAGSGALVFVGVPVVMGAVRGMLWVKNSMSIFGRAVTGARKVLRRDAINKLMIAGGSITTLGAGYSAFRRGATRNESKELFFSGFSEVDFERLLNEDRIAKSDYWMFVGTLFLFGGSTGSVVTGSYRLFKDLGKKGFDYVRLNGPFRAELRAMYDAAKKTFKNRKNLRAQARLGRQRITRSDFETVAGTKRALHTALSQGLEGVAGFTKKTIDAVTTQFMRLPVVKLYRTDPDFKESMKYYLLSDFLITTGVEVVVRQERFFDEFKFYLADIALTAALVGSVIYRTHQTGLVRKLSNGTAGFSRPNQLMAKRDRPRTFVDVFFKQKGEAPDLKQGLKTSFELFKEPGVKLLKDSMIVGGVVAGLSNLFLYGLNSEYHTAQERIESVGMTTLGLAIFMGVMCNGRMQALNSRTHRFRMKVGDIKMRKRSDPIVREVPAGPLANQRGKILNPLSKERVKKITAVRNAVRKQNEGARFGHAIRNDIFGSGVLSYSMSQVIEPQLRRSSSNSELLLAEEPIRSESTDLGLADQNPDSEDMNIDLNSESVKNSITTIIIPKDKTLMMFDRSNLFEDKGVEKKFNYL